MKTIKYVKKMIENNSQNTYAYRKIIVNHIVDLKDVKVCLFKRVFVVITIPD